MFRFQCGSEIRLEEGRRVPESWQRFSLQHLRRYCGAYRIHGVDRPKDNGGRTLDNFQALFQQVGIPVIELNVLSRNDSLPVTHLYHAGRCV